MKISIKLGLLFPKTYNTCETLGVHGTYNYLYGIKNNDYNRKNSVPEVTLTTTTAISLVVCLSFKL